MTGAKSGLKVSFFMSELSWHQKRLCNMQHTINEKEVINLIVDYMRGVKEG